MIAQASGGTMSVTGEKGQPPVKPGCTVGDTGTGMLMAISILGALYEKRETGKGRRLQLAIAGCGDALHPHLVRRDGEGRQHGAGAAHGRAKHLGRARPCGIYPTKPGGYNDYVYVFCSRANPSTGTGS